MTGLAKGLAGAAMPPCGSPGRKAISSAAVANLLAGRWQLGARLGRGSMGEVRAAVLWRFLPSALLVAGVLAAGAGALWLLQRTLVQPAMRLADHVRAQGAAAVDDASPG